MAEDALPTWAERLPGPVRDRVSLALAERNRLQAEVQQLAAETAEMAKTAKARAADAVQRQAVAQAHKVVRKIVGAVAVHAAGAITDPAMPRPVKGAVKRAVGTVMPEVEDEIMYVVEGKIRTTVAPDVGQPVGFFPNPYLWLRAKVLYALFPYDQTIWRQLRRPIWWLILLAKACPYFAISDITFLLLFIMRDRRDEFQLTNFIIGYKAVHFISFGCIPAIQAGYMLWLCSSEPNGCSASELPRMPLVDFFAFCFQILLTWVAFAHLPYSVRKGDKVFRHERGDDGEREVARHKWKGRRLLSWLVYDLVTFVASFAFFLFYVETDTSTTYAADEPLMEMIFLFQRIAYGLLALPWLFFKVPLFAMLLTHSRPTGYSPNGATLPLQKSKPKGDDDDAEAQDGAEPDKRELAGKELAAVVP